MNIQERIEALETEFAEKLKALKAETQQEQEFPKRGDKYWFVDSDTEVIASKWFCDVWDQGRLSIGNIFRTKEQAEFAAEKLKVEAELRKFSRPFECGAFNCCISLDTDEDCFYVDSSRYFQSQGTIHFESKVKAQQAIESVGEERIKKYIFGVEE